MQLRVYRDVKAFEKLAACCKSGKCGRKQAVAKKKLAEIDKKAALEKVAELLNRMTTTHDKALEKVAALIKAAKAVVKGTPGKVKTKTKIKTPVRGTTGTPSVGAMVLGQAPVPLTQKGKVTKSTTAQTNTKANARRKPVKQKTPAQAAAATTVLAPAQASAPTAPAPLWDAARYGNTTAWNLEYGRGLLPRIGHAIKHPFTTLFNTFRDPVGTLSMTPFEKQPSYARAYELRREVNPKDAEAYLKQLKGWTHARARVLQELLGVGLGSAAIAGGGELADWMKNRRREREEAIDRRNNV